MVKRSKSGRGDEAKLITRAPCFLAYYPGEQYFYCDRSEPAPAIPDVSEQRGEVSGLFMDSTHVASMDCCTHNFRAECRHFVDPVWKCFLDNQAV